MIQYTRLLLISLLAFFHLIAAAAPDMGAMQDAYSARVPVLSRTDDARTEAFELGLRRVYMQLTGHVDIDRYPALKRSFENASDWVVQYQYQQVGGDTYMLIRYDKKEVDGALDEAGLAIYTQGAPMAEGAPPNKLTLVVTGLKDLETYMRVDTYLNTLPGVTAVQTIELGMPTVTFEITLTEPATRLQEAMRSGEMLTVEQHEDDEGSDSNTFYYHYVGP